MIILKKRDEINNPKDIDIKKSYLNLIPEYISHFKLKNISDINNGLCEEIADDVIDMNGGETEYFYTINDGEFWDTEVTKYKTSEDGYYWQMDKIKKYGMPTFNLKFLSKFHLLGHTWIYYKGLHYDAETLDGVSNFWDLKIYQRQLSKLNIKLNESINSDILTLYHGTNNKHQFDEEGYLFNGTFFSDQKETAKEYGEYVYEVKFNKLNIMDLVYDKKHISELLQQFPVLTDDDYKLKITTVEKFYKQSDTWGLVEKKKY